MITLFQLNTFCCVVEEGSFRSAAERLFVSQPSVSQHIASLESHFGVRLFNRQKRRIRLTPEGRLLYTTAKEILGSLEDVKDRITNLQAMETGTLKLGCSPFASASLLPGVLRAFDGSFPSIRISLISGDWDFLLDLLKDNKAELVISERRLNVTIDPEITFHSIGEEKLCFVASPRVVGEKDEISPEEASSIPFITFSPDNNLCSYLDDLAIQNQIPFRSGLVVNRLLSAGNLAAEGLGAAFLPESFALSFSRKRHLKVFRIAGSRQATFEILAMYHRTHGLTYAGWELLKIFENRVLAGETVVTGKG
ncbi:MAG TPA: LysR family transcriptional regulator [Synergistales bacterium]|nr:LysR family transcriptional regulator [Synergistales bacterium]NLV64721.1 LysR family transcriptional regulator [Synergistaceae bacterium]HRW86883.1 LysR family transcriptional regulator [Thermovirgaceae bacterium]MDD3829637.1 LysR family transcriptional regulator [Synergistales bacterium]MDD4023169.1 LysR family transcriptional regulator [Synergistales bacterium]